MNSATTAMTWRRARARTRVAISVASSGFDALSRLRRTKATRHLLMASTATRLPLAEIVGYRSWAPRWVRGRIVGMPPIRRVLVLAVDGVQSLDVMGPIETFFYANQQAPDTYRIDVVGPARDGHITMSNGLKLAVDPLPEPPPRHDTLVVAGGEGARRAVDDAVVLDWITRASRRARRTTSICTGSYLLAAAGLLDGRRATTHWNFCEALAERYPAVKLDPDPVFVRDGDIWTSAGVTAGMDLALALVEED